MKPVRLMFLIVFVAVFFQYFVSAEKEELISRQFQHDENTCVLDDLELPVLQIVFLIDIALIIPWPLIQKEIVAEIIKLVTGQFKCEFALSAYGNWDNNGDNCYTLLQPFTTDADLILKKLDSITSEISFNIDLECSLTMALFLTVLDTNLAWNTELFVSTKQPTRKVIFTFPLRVSTQVLKDPGDRRVPMGDGTDTCQNSLPPTPEILQWVLEEHNILCVFGLFEIAGRVTALTDFYFNLVFPAEFELVVGITRSKVVLGVDVGFSPLDIIAGAFLNDALKLFNEMLSEVKSCYWEDPPPYNTLGL